MANHSPPQIPMLGNSDSGVRPLSLIRSTSVSSHSKMLPSWAVVPQDLKPPACVISAVASSGLPTARPGNVRKVVELPYHLLEVAKLIDPFLLIPGDRL